MNELEIQCIEYADSIGLLSYKTVSAAITGDPLYLFAMKNGELFHMLFPLNFSDGLAHWVGSSPKMSAGGFRGVLVPRGIPLFVCDHLDTFKKILEVY